MGNKGSKKSSQLPLPAKPPRSPQREFHILPRYEQNPRPVPNLNSYHEFVTSKNSAKLEPPNVFFQERISANSRLFSDGIDEQRRITDRKLQNFRNIEFASSRHYKPAPSINAILSVSPRLQNYRKIDLQYFEPKKSPPELTDVILDVIERASKPYPVDELLADLDGVQILRKDIQTLLGLNWLNDEIVNAYMCLLVLRGRRPNAKKVHAFNTFFYPKLRDSGYASVKRWTRKIDVFSHDYLLVPVHLGNHWCLAFVDLKEKTISYYDSLGGSPRGCCDILLNYLREESQDKKKQEFPRENWQLLNQHEIPRQGNGSDCGVFACQYAEYLSRQAKLDFSQEDMPYFRKKMIYEIVSKRILE